MCFLCNSTIFAYLSKTNLCYQMGVDFSSFANNNFCACVRGSYALYFIFLVQKDIWSWKMKVKVKIKKKTNRLLLTEKLMIYKRVELSSIPQDIRINNSSLYITALRLAREEVSVANYIAALNILYFDTCVCENTSKKAYLKKLFLNYIELNLFQGKKQFENYRKNIIKALELA